MCTLIYPNAGTYLFVQIAVFAIVMLIWFINRSSSPAI